MKMISDEKLFNESVYTEEGFKDRNDYLNSLADDYGIDIGTVKELASVLGPSEDFDALVTELEDMMYSKFNDSDEDDEEEYELEKYWLISYYDYELNKPEDSIKLYDESEKDDWIWEHCMKGSFVKCNNFDTGETTYYAPPEYGDEVVSPEDLQVTYKELQRRKDTSDTYDRHIQGYYTGKYESLKEGKGSDIPGYKVLTSKSIIDTDWYDDFDDEEEAENARMDIIDEWDKFLNQRGFENFYDDEIVYKLHFFNSPFRNDKILYDTIYDSVDSLAAKEGVDLVEFDNGNLGFVASYSGELDGFEILGKPTEKELHDYEYGEDDEDDDEDFDESLNESNSNVDFVKVEPIYTGGNIYVFRGELSDGTWFIADDSYYDVRIVNADVFGPDESFEDCWYADWQEDHLVRDLDEKEKRQFFKRMINWILENEPEGNYSSGDMENILYYINRSEEDLDDSLVDEIITIFNNELSNWSYEDFIHAGGSDKEDIARAVIAEFPDVPEESIYDLFWDWADSLDRDDFNDEDDDESLDESYSDNDVIEKAKENGYFDDMLEYLKSLLEYNDKKKRWEYPRMDKSGRDFYRYIYIWDITDDEKELLSTDIIYDNGNIEDYDWDTDVEEVQDTLSYDNLFLDSLFDALDSSLPESLTEDLEVVDSYIYPVYSSYYDRTFVMMVTKNKRNLTKEEVIGWYQGEPEDDLTKAYAGDTAAVFTIDDDEPWPPEYAEKEGWIPYGNKFDDVNESLTEASLNLNASGGITSNSKIQDLEDQLNAKIHGVKSTIEKLLKNKDTFGEAYNLAVNYRNVFTNLVDNIRLKNNIKVNEALNSQDQYNLSSAIYNAVSDVIFNSGKLDIDEKDVKFAFDRFIKKFFLDESLNEDYNDECWAVFIKDQDTGKVYCDGCYDSRGMAGYWAATDINDYYTIYNKNFKLDRIEKVPEYSSDLFSSNNELIAYLLGKSLSESSNKKSKYGKLKEASTKPLTAKDKADIKNKLNTTNDSELITAYVASKGNKKKDTNQTSVTESADGKDNDATDIVKLIDKEFPELEFVDEKDLDNNQVGLIFNGASNVDQVDLGTYLDGLYVWYKIKGDKLLIKADEDANYLEEDVKGGWEDPEWRKYFGVDDDSFYDPYELEDNIDIEYDEEEDF